VSSVRCPECGVEIERGCDWCLACGYDPDGLRPPGWQPARATPPSVPGWSDRGAGPSPRGPEAAPVVKPPSVLYTFGRVIGWPVVGCFMVLVLVIVGSLVIVVLFNSCAARVGPAGRANAVRVELVEREHRPAPGERRGADALVPR